MKSSVTNQSKAITKILIANRGEIALRIQRTAHEMGIATVAVYAAADKGATFVTRAGEAVFLEGSQLSATYLNMDKIIAAAKQTNADAIHPGYGFLSENAGFADACQKEGIIFIGPGTDAIRAMGNKIVAREMAVKAGIPVTPGITGPVDMLLSNYKNIGLPILIKAAAGGGGKGMRVVYKETEIKPALEATAREAKNYFGDETVYIEKYVEKPRHIEVQVLGDQHGNMVHLYERECSLQRRHQKIIEEAPSPSLPENVRENICSAAADLAKSIGYYSAGTIEFLVDEALNFYFLEMNTRIQVEHPVTELTTGTDIVAQQIKVAQGETLFFTQQDIRQNGHAIECRIYAEDPEQNFLPSPGLVEYYEEPLCKTSSSRTNTLSPLAAIRIDGMELKTGDTISEDFDPMISKLTVWAPTREEARLAMLTALDQYHIKGIKTNIVFLGGLLRYKDFIENNISTKYIDNQLSQLIDFIKDKKNNASRPVLIAACLAKSFENSNDKTGNPWRTIGYWRHLKTVDIIVEGKIETVHLINIHGNNIEYNTNNQEYIACLKHNTGLNYTLCLDGTTHSIGIYEYMPGHYEISFEGLSFTAVRQDISYVDAAAFKADASSGSDPGNIVSPMPGKVIKINVQAGDSIKKGDILLIVEAMKMENNITSPVDGIAEKISVIEGDKVDTSMRLVKIKPNTGDQDHK